MATIIAYPEIKPLRKSQEDMAINETDKAWIRQEIAISQKRSGWGHVSGFLKDWGGLVGIGGLVIFVISQWSQYIEFRTHTNDTLNTIDSRMTKIEAQVAKTSEYIDNALKGDIRNKADLPQNSFNQNLPSVADALRSATHQGIRLDSGVLKTINDKLERSPQDRPGYWPTTGALVSAQSVIGKSEDFLTKAQKLPDCPNPSGGPNFVGLRRVINDCALILDGWTFRDSIFSGIVVKYRGGPLTLQNTRFINCIFIIELPTTPPPPAKTFARQLLAETNYEDILVTST